MLTKATYTLLFCSWFGCAAVQAGEVIIYYWKDSKGQDQYSDSKPKGVDYKTMRLGLYEGYKTGPAKQSSSAPSRSSGARTKIPPSTIPASKMSDGNKRDTKAIWREKRPKLCEFYQKQQAEIAAQGSASLSAEQQAKLDSRARFVNGQVRAYCR